MYLARQMLKCDGNQFLHRSNTAEAGGNKVVNIFKDLTWSMHFRASLGIPFRD